MTTSTTIFDTATKVCADEKSSILADLDKYQYLFKNFDENILNGTVVSLSSNLLNPHDNEVAGMLLIHEVVCAAGTLSQYLQNYRHRLSARVYNFMTQHLTEYQDFLDKYHLLNYHDCDVFSASTFIKNYSLSPHYGEKPLESPLQMYLRVATHFYCDRADSGDASPPVQLIFKTVLQMALHYYTPASPTLYNAGTTNSQGSSCFLATIDDNLDSILGTGVHDMGIISKHKGGLGIGIGKLRHSEIKGGGMASGVIPVARILDKLVLYVDQGGSRSGAGTVHLPLWHYDVYDFINSTNNFGQSQVTRLQFLNTCVWIPDLFVRRSADKNAVWTVFCPSRAHLYGLHSSEFEERYLHYEKLAEEREQQYLTAKKEYEAARLRRLEGKSGGSPLDVSECLQQLIKSQEQRIVHRKLNAFDLLSHICDVQIKSGFPFVMYGDSINSKSNQANLGTVNSSNLCVSGDTMIMTREHGYVQIDKVVQKEVTVWNGTEWSPGVVPRQTSRLSDFVRVQLSNGLTLDCTEYHKFLVNNLPPTSMVIVDQKSCQHVDAVMLKPGDRLLNFEYPVIEGGGNNHDGGHDETHYANGWTFGQNILKSTSPHGTDVTIIFPDLVSSVRTRVRWLNGLFDSIGKLVIIDHVATLMLFCKLADVLRDLQLLVSTLGATASTKDNVIKIRGQQLAKLLKLGFSTQYLLLGKTVDEGFLVAPNEPVSVVKVEYLDVFSPQPSYCFYEPLKNAGVFGGVLTRNCVEICEVSTPKTIASCNLSSISLKAFVVKENIEIFNERWRALTTREQQSSADTFVSVLAKSGAYNFKLLGEMVRSVVDNLDEVITHNQYPVSDKTKALNMNTRPLGIGVSGFDDALKALDLVFESVEADAFNKGVFACMYFNALTRSSELAVEKSAYPDFKSGVFTLESVKTKSELENAYSSGGLKVISTDFSNGVFFKHVLAGSPLSNGLFQFDLWKERADVMRACGTLSETVYIPEDDIPVDPASWGGEDTGVGGGGWNNLRHTIRTSGMRNSMLLTCMPTASTGQLLRNAESTEAHGSNLYSRAVKCGNFIVFNHNLYRDLAALGFYNHHTVDYLMAAKGSMKYFLQFVTEYASGAYPSLEYSSTLLSPDNTKKRLEHLIQKYKTMFEISQKNVLRKARQRGIYIDQSQSTNLYIEDPSVNTMRAVHSFGNKLGLKTGLYYLRQRNAAEGGGYTLSAALTKFKNEVIDVVNGYEREQKPPPVAPAASKMCPLRPVGEDGGRSNSAKECMACS
jgi:ribonucleotide reductase alpha subunit